MAIKKTKRGSIDELALTRAAAWAWYQHQSGSETKPITREYDQTTRVRTPPTPSRYKLEAMRLKTEDEGGKTITETPKSVDTDNNSLLDTYELETLARQLDDLVMKPSSTPKFGFHGRSNSRVHDHKNICVPKTDAITNGKQIKKVDHNNKKKKILQRFCKGYAVMCGARGDVAGNAIIPIISCQSGKGIGSLD